MVTMSSTTKIMQNGKRYKISRPIFMAEVKPGLRKARRIRMFSDAKQKKMPLNFVDSYKKLTFAGLNGYSKNNNKKNL